MTKLDGLKMALIAFVFCTVTGIASPAQSFTTLLSFNPTDGVAPNGPLVQGTDGNFYGTTTGGGANLAGTVFRVTPKGALTTLYSFCAQPYCTDGSDPVGALVQGTDGNFYGTTYGGGAFECCCCGTIFKITPGGTLTTLHVFQGGGVDSAYPMAGLVQGRDGIFYGETYGGGDPSDPFLGTVFKITPAGTLTTLHWFCGCGDDINPLGGLVQGSDGNFYGTTTGGFYSGGGSVFKITPQGTLTTLYSFTGGADGCCPFGGLLQATDGNFYGTTSGLLGWDLFGDGTVFQITPAGTLTTLWTFCSKPNCTDGLSPQTGLVQGTDGNLYGTTFFGGINGGGYGGGGGGTVFRITSGGALTTLHRFCSTISCSDGAGPGGGWCKALTGNFTEQRLGVAVPNANSVVARCSPSQRNCIRS